MPHPQQLSMAVLKGQLIAFGEFQACATLQPDQMHRPWAWHIFRCSCSCTLHGMFCEGIGGSAEGPLAMLEML